MKNCKTIILGLGNTILTDDGAGIYVVREIQKILRTTGFGLRATSDPPAGRAGEQRATVVEASAGGFNFIDLLAGYDRAVIVDAIHTKGGKPGEFYELDAAALKPTTRTSSLHQIDFATACDLAAKMGIDFPKEIAIFVMEIADEFTFGETPTPRIAKAIPVMAAHVLDSLHSRGWL